MIEKLMWVCEACGTYTGKKEEARTCKDCGVDGCKSCFVIKDGASRCQYCTVKYIDESKKNKQSICLHLHTEFTHPYGWEACVDCGKLLD